MNRLFVGFMNFNVPLNNWNVSNVTNMSNMFKGCYSFKQPLNNWNVSNVTNMASMFERCLNYKQSLDNWNVSNVTNMASMFRYCYSFNKPLNNWNVSKVTNMASMFEGCRGFKKNINKWNVSNVTNMANMFEDCVNFNQPLNNWNVSNVTNMARMFKDCVNFNQPLNTWNVQNVTNINQIFLNCRIEEQNKPTFRPTLNALGTPLREELRELQFWNEAPPPHVTIRHRTINEPPPPNVTIRPRNRTEPSPPLPPSFSPEELAILRNLTDNIQVSDIVLGDDVSASQFMEQHSDYNPFIVRNRAGIYTGSAIKWPAPSSSGNEFIECDDNTPSGWLGNSYKRYVKPDAKLFIKMIVSGSPTMVEKPDWYDNGWHDSAYIPGTKIFQLVKSGEVNKFMTTVLESGNLPADFTALGTDHCNQTSPIGAYRLEPISIDELSKYVSERVSGGKTRKTTRYHMKRKLTRNNKKRQQRK